MAPVCGATGVWGSAVASKGGLVWGEPSRHWASAAGEITPLVSVMSGQSLSVPGPEMVHAAPSEMPNPLVCWPILFCSKASWDVYYQIIA